jgi:hypothetical protein
MKHIQNDFMRIQLQNAMMSQEVAESAKLRQTERARAKAADAVEKLHEQTDDKGVKVTGVSGKKTGEQKERSQGSRTLRYRPDGTIEEESGNTGNSGAFKIPRIDIKT